MRRLILASASPRRRQLLEMLGLKYELSPADVDESAEGAPREQALLLAGRKAEAAALGRRDGLILAADTLVDVDGQALGKPKDEAEACGMLARLAGSWHLVHTGMCLLDAKTGKSLLKTVTARVRMGDLSAEEIHAYVRSGEPMDKAGAYGIQGLGGSLVEEIEGDYFAVMGLSLFALRSMLKEMGFSVFKL
ncbi:MAG: Maf family protein [Christensenellaceae bacterium]|jgi:septum formation protein|nr:Maf family protein [Christensenellaceae bacterium]